MVRTVVCTLFLSSFSAPAWATIDNLKALKQAYPEAKAVSCKTCHQGAIGKKGDLNLYGKALQAVKGEGKALKLTPEEIRSIDQDDADKDGTSNHNELVGGTDPGSVPHQ